MTVFLVNQLVLTKALLAHRGVEVHQCFDSAVNEFK